MSRKKRKRSRRRPSRTPGEYFLASVGAIILIVAFVVIVTPSSCHRPTDSGTGVPAQSR